MPGRLVARALTVLAVLVPLLAAGLVQPTSASAGETSEPQRRWSSSVATVCVESHVGRAWDVKGAIGRWNRLEEGPTFVLEASCPVYADSVTIRLKGQKSRFTGWTDWFWDATGHIVHAEVTVNPTRLRAFDRQDRACMRKHTTTHELGHVLGLEHYPHSHAGAVMSYLDWRRHCGALTAHDRSDLRKLYPASTGA